jgi:Mg/Co/Ni transporter MgtE
MLLGMSASDAAVILRGYPRAKRGELLQGVAAARPAAAGEILDVLDVTTAAQAFSYLKPATAVSVLGAMREADAVRILTRLISFDSGAASVAFMHMPVQSAVNLLRAIPAELGAGVLAGVWPASIEAMSSVDPDLIQRLRARRTVPPAR